MIQFAHRLAALGTNVFADMDRAKTAARSRGMALIDLSLGSSDLPVAPQIRQAIAQALDDPATHGYTLFGSTAPFRQAIALWMHQRYGLTIDPETEIMPLIGSQEGTAHMPLALLNLGDGALLTNPGYPSHYGGVALAGGTAFPMDLRPEHGFLPQFEEIPADVVAQSRMMVLSYPHNPTAAVAPLDFFQKAVDFCAQHHIALVHDFPYADFVFSGDRPPSALQARKARDLAVEFYTFSKSYNMGGFRIGFAVGNAELIAALRTIKTVIDFNQYQGITQGAIAALQSGDSLIGETMQTFGDRRDAVLLTLNQLGWPVPCPHATPYFWIPLPPPWQQDSLGFCLALLNATGLVLSPGSGFGSAGEGYVRLALVQPKEVLVDAVHTLWRFLHVQS